jgi:hypothetical protein
MGIFKIFGKSNKGNSPKFPEREHIEVSQNVKMIPYFVYSNTENRIIGEILLTEDQAYELNQYMRYKGTANQDIAFLME